MTLTVPASYYAVGILDQSQRDRAYRLALDIAAHIDAGRWSNATAARSVLFDYIDGANGPDTAPNVDSFLKYGEYDEPFTAFLNSAETKKSLNLPALKGLCLLYRPGNLTSLPLSRRPYSERTSKV